MAPRMAGTIKKSTDKCSPIGINPKPLKPKNNISKMLKKEIIIL